MNSFDLETAIATWRQFHARRRVFLKEDLDELERHLRDHTAHLVAQGLDEEAAFWQAVRALGASWDAEDEYRKVYWGKRRRRGEVLRELIWRGSMLTNHFKVALRHVKKQKGYAFINVFGLAVGIACCLLIALYVQEERSYDRYHDKADRIYRVLHAYPTGNDPANLPPLAPTDFQVYGNAPVGPALLNDFPEVTEVVQFSGRVRPLLTRGERRFREDRVTFMDSTVFDVFSWPLLAGDPDRALVAPYSMVLTESTARKYFGDENPIGQTITVDLNGTFLYTVTGVMADIPPTSHVTFDVLLAMSSLRQMRPETYTNWSYVDFYTYFLVRESTDLDALKAKIPDFTKRHVPSYLPYALSFERLTDAYLRSQATRQPGAVGSTTNLYVFSAIALFILLIACINFMNLSTARSMTRAKEVGIRKVVGARRRGLVGQFLVESTALSLAATVIALGLTALLLPAFRQLSGKAIAADRLFAPEGLLILLGASLAVGVLAGSYPALVLARFRPVAVLKGAFRSTAQGAFLRKALVVFQFGLSVVLIAGTTIVYSQLDYLRSKDLGFRQDQMLVIHFGYDTAVQQQIDPLKASFLAHPAVQSASASRTVPGTGYPAAYTQIESTEGEIVHNTTNLYEVDGDFLSTFDIQLAAGRAFSPDVPTDTAQALILNEAATRRYGFARPEEAVGQRFVQWDREGAVIGVVRNFNYRSLHHAIEPMSFRIARRSEVNRLTLRLQTDQLATTLADLQRQWDALVPHRPFLYSFLDESFNQQYQADQRFGQVFSVFAVLAIFIACLGLFGLASFTAEQRTKEIGVRKVLGASVPSIVALLSTDFLKLVGIAFLVAAPLAYVVMNRWLDAFAYRIELSWWIFLGAGLAALGVALLTVSYQAIKAALADPVKALQYE